MGDGGGGVAGDDGLEHDIRGLPSGSKMTVFSCVSKCSLYMFLH